MRIILSTPTGFGIAPVPSPLGLDASEDLLKVRMAEKQNFSTVGYFFFFFFIFNVYMQPYGDDRPTVGYLSDGNDGDCFRRIFSTYLRVLIR